MRDIKFRAWDRIGKKMLYNTPIEFWNKCNSYMVSNKYQEKNVLHCTELMQYIGLKDCNGKEVYEGDILEFESNGLAYDKNKKYIAKVIFIDCNFALVGINIDNQWIGSKSIFNLRIIGNIYEKPELLEGV